MILSRIRFGVIILLAAVIPAVATTTTARASSLTDRLQNPQAQVLGRSGPHAFTYVALGDSVAAGLGYAPFPDATDEDKACGRSIEAYAHTVAAGIDAAIQPYDAHITTTNVSCAGATTKHLLQAQPLGNTTVKPQLDKAFEKGTPTLLTITSGANDVRWASFLALCFSGSNCNTPENTAAAEAYINTAKSDLRTALKSIKARSYFLPPFVVATGYYNPVSDRCISSNLSDEEVEWIIEANGKLNSAIRDVTSSYWFARFAPVDFTGHDICSTDSWIQRPGVPGEPASFHPTPRGQKAIGESILDTIGVPR